MSGYIKTKVALKKPGFSFKFNERVGILVRYMTNFGEVVLFSDAKPVDMVGELSV